MKITEQTINLARAEMLLLEDEGPDGDAFRYQVRSAASEITRATNRPVMIETPDYTVLVLTIQVFPK